MARNQVTVTDLPDIVFDQATRLGVDVRDFIAAAAEGDAIELAEREKEWS